MDTEIVHGVLSASSSRIRTVGGFLVLQWMQAGVNIPADHEADLCCGEGIVRKCESSWAVR